MAWLGKNETEVKSKFSYDQLLSHGTEYNSHENATPNYHTGALFILPSNFI